ncbi:hypothetical protein DL98DRAFT_213704 [Cadophora sp. DSE1049]|nr:hypothetical protein DL98DRAFT_213704 [Cadophora sp. DSE1049]
MLGFVGAQHLFAGAMAWTHLRSLWPWQQFVQLRSHSKCCPCCLAYVLNWVCSRTPLSFVTFRYHIHTRMAMYLTQNIGAVHQVFLHLIRFSITSLFYCSYEYGLTPTFVCIRAKCMASDKSPIQYEQQKRHVC